MCNATVAQKGPHARYVFLELIFPFILARRVSFQLLTVFLSQLLGQQDAAQIPSL
jgi:hypothetical protein